MLAWVIADVLGWFGLEGGGDLRGGNSQTLNFLSHHLRCKIIHLTGTGYQNVSLSLSNTCSNSGCANASLVLFRTCCLLHSLFALFLVKLMCV